MVQQASVHGSWPVSTPPLPLQSSRDAEALWHALSCCTGLDIAVFSVSGRLLYISPVLHWWSRGPTDQGGVGRHLSELTTPEVAAERLALVQRAVDTKAPVAAYHSWLGVMLLLVVYPLTDSLANVDRVMMIGRPLSRADQGLLEPRPGDTHAARLERADDGPLHRLTRRELEVLTLIGHGLTSGAIAARLDRSRKTVEAHRLSIGAKLGAHNRLQLAKFAIEAGLTYLPIHPPIAPFEAIADSAAESNGHALEDDEPSAADA
jgi:DNA-binding CsgD family transcriptional regulator